MYKRDIYLDIDDNLNNYIKSVELDSNSRVWHFHLTVDYEPLDLTGKSVQFRAEKPDKTNVLNDCKIVDAENGVVEVKLTRQVNAIPGHVKCLLKIIGDEGFELKTKTFVVDVSKALSDDAIVSSDEFGALEAALGKVQDIDNRFAQTNAQLSDKASKQDLAVESARIDNLIKLEEGSTTGDAELADIRIGSDKIYQTAGSSVRGQISNIKNALDHELKYVLGNNIFNKNEVTEGYRVNPDSGNIVVSESKWVSDYIQVKPKEELVFLAKNSSKKFEYYGLEYVFFDMRGDVVNFGELSRQNDEQYLTVPSGCYFVRISSGVDLTTDIIFGSRRYWINSDFVNDNYEEYTEPYYKLKEVYATEKDFELSDKKNSTNIGVLKDDMNDLKNGLEHEFDYITPLNLLDKSKITENSKVNPTNGNVEPSSSRCVSDYIKIKDGDELVYLGQSGSGTFKYYQYEYVFYNESKDILSYGLLETSDTEQFITTPKDAYFVRISFGLAVDRDMVFGLKTHWTSPEFAKENYEEYTKPYYKLKSEFALNDDLSDVKNGLLHEFDYITPRNFLDKGKITPNMKVNSTNGCIEPSNSRSLSDYMRVNEGDKIVFIGESGSGVFRYYQFEYVIYNVDKEVIGFGALPTSDTEQFVEVPNDGYFVRISFGLDVTRKMVFGLMTYWINTEFTLKNFEDYKTPYYKLKKEFLDKEVSVNVPEYWINEINRIVSVVNTKFEDGMKKQEPMFAFFFSSDNHYTSEAVRNADVSADLMRYIADKTGITLNLNGGDLLEDRTSRTTALAKESKWKSIDDIRYISQRLASATPIFLTTQGNHDDNCQIVNYDTDGNALRFEERAIYGKEWAKECVQPYSHINMKVGPTQKYYYVDDDYNKVRFICIDSMEGDYRSQLNGSLGTVNTRPINFTDQQIEWVRDVVLPTTPTYYSVLFFSHVSPVFPSVTTLDGQKSSIGSVVPKNNEKMIDVINNYVAGGGTVIGYFTGHIHYDTITNVNNVNYIQILNDGLYEKDFNSKFNVEQPEKRVLGTTKECAFDVVIVNQSTKHVDMVRVGAGNDRGFDY